MKFKVNENLALWELEEEITDKFAAMSEDELLSLLDSNMNVGGPAVWILPSGDTYSMDIHLDMCEKLFDKFCKKYFEENPSEEFSEDDMALEDAHWFCDVLVDKFKWIKFNSGSIFDSRYYVVVPNNITRRQYIVLEDVLVETYRIPDTPDKQSIDGLLVLTISPNRKQYYSFKYNSPSDIIRKLKRFTSSGILEEGRTLTEDCWYKVGLSSSIGPEGSSSDTIYVWARNDDTEKGIAQVNDIITSALAGLYRGRGKEQSFNRSVADALKNAGGVSVSSVEPILGSPPSFDWALSRTDRGLRRSAHGHMTSNQLSDLQASNPEIYDKISRNNCLIHHHNLKKEEGDNSSLMVIPYSDTVGLGLANIGHGLIHTVTDNCKQPLKPGSYNFTIYDITSNGAVEIPVSIIIG